jgi:hypothetical protein
MNYTQQAAYSDLGNGERIHLQKQFAMLFEVIERHLKQ